MSTTSSTGTTGTAVPETKAPQNSKVDLGLLEEDDEFEEFPTETWASKNGEEDEEVKVWEDNWDDDNIEDDFSLQLKAELVKQGFIHEDGTPTAKPT